MLTVTEDCRDTILFTNGVFRLAYSGTGTGDRNRHWKIGLYDIMQNISHYTRTGTRLMTGDFKNGFQTQFPGPEIESSDQL